MIKAIKRLIVLVIISFLVFNSCDTEKGKETKNPKIRVAWMTSWATAGQVVEALINTDILKKNNLKVEFKRFLFGPPMNEAAVAGDVDVTIVGDMPAILLLSNSSEWLVICKTISFPYGLMVRSDLKIDNVSQLKNKIIGVPFGSGPHPTLYSWLDDAGLKIGKNVSVINLLPNEMSEAIRYKRVDAIMTWEPTMTILELNGSAKIIKQTEGIGLMCMRKWLIEKHPDIVKRFIQSWKDALLYTAQNRKQTDEWFSIDSRFQIELLKKIKVVDGNLSAKSLKEVNVVLTEDEIKKNQLKADFALKQGLIKNKLELLEFLYRK